VFGVQDSYSVLDLSRTETAPRTEGGDGHIGNRQLLALMITRGGRVVGSGFCKTPSSVSYL